MEKETFRNTEWKILDGQEYNRGKHIIGHTLKNNASWGCPLKTIIFYFVNPENLAHHIYLQRSIVVFNDKNPAFSLLFISNILHSQYRKWRHLEIILDVREATQMPEPVQALPPSGCPDCLYYESALHSLFAFSSEHHPWACVSSLHSRWKINPLSLWPGNRRAGCVLYTGKI